MKNKLRLYSGLVLLAYVTGHLLTHMLGIVSIDAMNAGLRITDPPWRSLPGTVLLSAALLLHVGLALWSVYSRRTLRMKRSEMVQLVFGLTIPFLLVTHVIGTRVVGDVFDVGGDYLSTLIYFRIFKPNAGLLQMVLVIVVWVHGMIGLHMWLRLKPWYQDLQAWMLSIAVLIPALSLAGFVSAGTEVLQLAQEDGWIDNVMSARGRQPEMAGFVESSAQAVQIGAALLIIAIFAARALRQIFVSRRGKGRLIRYAPGDRSIPLIPGATLLESLRVAGVQHPSVCGGRGRCSTCRVRVEEGGDALAAMDENEQRVLNRVGASGPVRLACQIKPDSSIRVAALLRPGEYSSILDVSRAQRQGDELMTAILFVDLRGSTRLGEDRLPFDVVFILNQFFAELSGALAETNGHYAQFNGDGLMAIYGLDADTDIATACRQSVAGAQAMFRRLDALNKRLDGELSEPLKIGIGIHAGEAIIGSMGPPATPIVSALGDNVNIAARLESQTKEFGVPLVISARVAEYGGIDSSALTMREIPVKGRERPVRVYPVAQPMELASGGGLG